MTNRQKMRLVVLSGAGMSADSGVSTFRDADGLWERHRIEDVATPQAWNQNPELVLDFYNQRRRQLFEVEPNEGHIALADLQAHFDVRIITQNVDDLHERAGSRSVMHLHGELRKVRSTLYPELVYDWTEDLRIGDLCARGAQLRPHIVWFNEAVPMIGPAAEEVAQADLLLVVGTSLQVYPAAGLSAYASPQTPIWYIDPHPAPNYELKQSRHLTIIAERAARALPEWARQIAQQYANI